MTDDARGPSKDSSEKKTYRRPTVTAYTQEQILAGLGPARASAYFHGGPNDLRVVGPGSGTFTIPD